VATPLDNASQGVKSYPELGLEALRRRHDGPYGLWLLARSIDREGSGRVDRRELWHATRDTLGVTRQTFGRWLKAGDGLYFLTPYHPRTVYLVGIFRVVTWYGLRLRRPPVLIPTSRLQSRKGWRTELLASFLAGKPKTISQRRLSEMCGVSDRTVRDYLKRDGRIKRQSNFLLSARPVPPRVVPELARAGFFRAFMGGRWRMLKRLPSTLWIDDRDQPRVCARGILNRQPVMSSFLTAGGATSRLFFEDPKAQARRLNRLQDDEVMFALTKDEGSSGARLWRGFQGVNGKVVAC